MLLLISAKSPAVPPRVPACVSADRDTVADRWSTAGSCMPDATSVPLCVLLHLLCITLLPCRKKHTSFVVYSSQSGSEMGVVSCFLCSPDRTDRHPVALFDFLHVFFKETEQSHHHNNKSSPPLFYKHVLDFQLWVISDRSLMPKDNTLMKTTWCKGYTEITERSSMRIRLTLSVTAAR